MRYVFLLLSCIGLFTLSCSKEKIEEYTVVKSCSFETLLVNGSNAYYICNEGKLSDYKNGDVINAKIKLESCKPYLYGCSINYETSEGAKITRILK